MAGLLLAVYMHASFSRKLFLGGGVWLLLAMLEYRDSVTLCYISSRNNAKTHRHCAHVRLEKDDIFCRPDILIKTRIVVVGIQLKRNCHCQGNSF